MYALNPTAKTIFTTDEWINLFKKNNYSGDFITSIMNKLLKKLYFNTRIRLVENRIASEYKSQNIRCPVHLSIAKKLSHLR